MIGTGLRIDVAADGAEVKETRAFVEMCGNQRQEPRIVRALGDCQMEIAVGLDEGLDALALLRVVTGFRERFEPIEIFS